MKIWLKEIVKSKANSMVPIFKLIVSLLPHIFYVMLLGSGGMGEKIRVGPER